MSEHIDCPVCGNRKIHVSADACEQCEWAAWFARDKELEQVKAERDEAIRERDIARMQLGEVLAALEQTQRHMVSQARRTLARALNGEGT